MSNFQPFMQSSEQKERDWSKLKRIGQVHWIFFEYPLSLDCVWSFHNFHDIKGDSLSQAATSIHVPSHEW